MNYGANVYLGRVSIGGSDNLRLSSLGGMLGPVHPELALAPDRGALGYQTGSLAARMAFGRLRGPWGVGTKVLFRPAGCPPVVCGYGEAGDRSPGRFLG